MYPSGGDIPDWKFIKDFLLKEGNIPKNVFLKLIKDSINCFSKFHLFNFLLEKEANMVKIGEPIVIVGDLHGQYYDMVHMLEKAGDPADIK
jgi:serine/threonine-protein phosphatase 2B catalytic subunit